jgi:hypothetical protein
MEKETITDELAEKFNRQACEMVVIFFKELASFTADDIYEIASTASQEPSEILLEKINAVFSKFIENGEGLPRVFFDSYIRTAEQFVQTFKINIENKLEQNTELLVQMATEKKSEDISYTDIAKAIPEPVNEEVEETQEAEEAPKRDIAPEAETEVE